MGKLPCAVFPRKAKTKKAKKQKQKPPKTARTKNSKNKKQCPHKAALNNTVLDSVRESDCCVRRTQVACTELTRCGEVTKEGPERWSTGFSWRHVRQISIQQ